jgi:AraC-like DNA-binding protein
MRSVWRAPRGASCSILQIAYSAIVLDALASAAASLARSDGHAAPTELDLLVHRRSLPAPPAIREIEPRFSAVLQGGKRVRLGRAVDDMRAGHYSVLTRPAAIGTGVARATPRTPYLAVVIRLDPERVISAIGRGDPDGLVAASGGLGDPDRRAPALGDDAVGSPHTGRSSALDDGLAAHLLALLDSPTRAHERAFLIALAATEHGPALRSFAARALDPLVAAALAWLEAHVDAPVAIEQLARAIGASESSLHHRFKRATGTTPGQHHKRLRLQRARDLLSLGAASSRDIARRVGYASSAQFTRDYRRAFAITPGRDARAYQL